MSRSRCAYSDRSNEAEVAGTRRKLRDSSSITTSVVNGREDFVLRDNIAANDWCQKSFTS